MAKRRGDVLGTAHALLPALIAVPVVVSIVVTTIQVLATRHPELGWTQTIANDGRALASGATLYAEPGTQYTGMLYPPLFAALLAPLYRLAWWDGWPLLITVASGAGLAGLVGAIAASGPRRRMGEAVLGGAGVGAAAWWMVSTNRWSSLYTARTDQLAWLLALSGLCVFALSVAHRWPRTWPAVALLSAALWTKQSTLGALVAAAVMATWWAASERLPWRRWLRFVGGLAVTNGLILGILLVATDGWIWYFLIDLPGRHYSDPAMTPYVSELLRLLAIPLAVVVMAGGAAWLTRRRAIPPASFVALLASLLVAFLVIQVGPAWLGRRKQGGGVNQYLGMMWALGLLWALAHREARQDRRAMAAGVVASSLLAALVFLPPLQDVVSRRGVVDPQLLSTGDVEEIDPRLIDYSRSHLVYETSSGVLSPTLTHEAWPQQPNINDLLAAGESPDYVVDALIVRRFDAVTRFSELASGYTARSGRSDPEYLAALNALVELGYAAGDNDAPFPLLGRRPGSLDLSWARPCFEGARPAACLAAGG